MTYYEIGTYYGFKDGLWYWRLRAQNGKIIADGSEGYATRYNARRAAKALIAAGLAGRIVLV